MTSHTHQTAPTQFVEANGIRFACRRFGSAARRAPYGRKPTTWPEFAKAHAAAFKH